MAIGVLVSAAVLAGVGCDGDDSGPSQQQTIAAQPSRTPASPSTLATPSAPELKVAAIEGAEVLTNAEGLTLYVFANDNAGDGTSACNGACRSAWPPFIIEGTGVTAPAAITAQVGTIVRIEGTNQVTYNGKPLYTFANDTAPGDMNGDGLGGTWSVARP
jgi:predicted lipoprotein with Yx(FWY)xxD motif